MKIRVNGESRSATRANTVAELLEELQIVPKHVAVEVNLEIVPRSRHAEHTLREGDSVEVVTLVGGG